MTIKRELIKHVAVTKVICNKGFRGNLSILPRSNYGVGGQESSPQSLTAYSLNRYAKQKIYKLYLWIYIEKRNNRKMLIYFSDNLLY